MTDLKAGPETDRLVAEAIGVPVMQSAGDEPCVIGKNIHHSSGQVQGVEVEFHPSTDLNDAFWAAEQVRLFELHCLTGTEDLWRVEESNMYPETISRSETPALAICAAIIELKEKT